MHDKKRLIDIVAARDGIRIEPGDPAFAVVTLAEYMLDDVASRIASEIAGQLAGLEASMQGIQKRAGAQFAQEVKAAATQVRAELQRDLDAANIKAAHLVYLVDRAHKRPARLWSLVLAYVSAAILVGASFWLGLNFRVH